MDNTVSIFKVLPYEILLEIFYKMNIKTLSNMSQTAQWINEMFNDDTFWKNKYERDFGFSSRGSWGLKGFEGTPLLRNGTKWKELYKLNVSHNKYSPISAGSYHYAIIDKTGILYTAGKNHRSYEFRIVRDAPYFLTVRSFATLDRNGFISVGLPNITGVYCGNTTTSSIAEDGVIYQSGLREYNRTQILHWHYKPKSTKTIIKHLSDGSLAVTLYNDGSIAVFGNLRNFELDDVLQLDAIDIEITNQSVYYISKNRGLYMFGKDHGGLMVGIEKKDTEIKIVPVHIDLSGKVIQVSANKYHTVVLLSNGCVYTWGFGFGGILGLGFDAVDDKYHKSRKVDLPPVLRIATSENKTAIVTKDRRIFIWGTSEKGSIIDDDTYDLLLAIPTFSGIKTPKGTIFIPSPLEIDIGLPIDYIDLGNDFTIAATTDGDIHYWGDPQKVPKCLRLEGWTRRGLFIGKPVCPLIKNSAPVGKKENDL